jgi:hypothetical protein
MKTLIDKTTDSINSEVRRLKEQNAAEHGFDLRKIANAARARQMEHPERMVTRILTNAKQVNEEQSITRPALKEELCSAVESKV